jgi:cyclopropane-fatty-acyl-phospholipid synthase
VSIPTRPRPAPALRPHFRAWLANLEAGWNEAVADVSEERARSWRLFLALGAAGCERGWIGAAHTVATRCGHLRTL